MIYGIGVDIVQNSRIRKAYMRWGKRFVERAFSLSEQELFLSRPDPIPLMAVRFAAKEAFSKALKTGLKRGIRLRDIEMLHKASGEPYLVLAGKAKELIDSLNISGVHVSVSHERDYSVATVILER